MLDVDMIKPTRPGNGLSAEFIAKVRAARRDRAAALLVATELQQARTLLAKRGCPAAVRDLIERIAVERKVSMLAIVTGRRGYQVVKARDEAIYDIRQRQTAVNRSLTRIGDYLGLDHTTVMAALARYSLRSGRPALTESSYYRRRVLKDLAA